MPQYRWNSARVRGGAMDLPSLMKENLGGNCCVCVLPAFLYLATLLSCSTQYFTLGPFVPPKLSWPILFEDILEDIYTCRIDLHRHFEVVRFHQYTFRLKRSCVYTLPIILLLIHSGWLPARQASSLRVLVLKLHYVNSAKPVRVPLSALTAPRRRPHHLSPMLPL